MREQLGNLSYRETPRQLFGYVRRLQVRKVSGLDLERFTNTRLNFTRVNTFTFTHDLSYIASILFAKVVLRTYALKRYARQWSPPLV